MENGEMIIETPANFKPQDNCDYKLAQLFMRMLVSHGPITSVLKIDMRMPVIETDNRELKDFIGMVLKAKRLTELKSQVTDLLHSNDIKNSIGILMFNIGTKMFKVSIIENNTNTGFIWTMGIHVESRP